VFAKLIGGLLFHPSVCALRVLALYVFLHICDLRSDPVLIDCDPTEKNNCIPLQTLSVWDLYLKKSGTNVKQGWRLTIVPLWVIM
jgi:hypothetical protein